MNSDDAVSDAETLGSSEDGSWQEVESGDDDGGMSEPDTDDDGPADPLVEWSDFVKKSGFVTKPKQAKYTGDPHSLLKTKVVRIWDPTETANTSFDDDGLALVAPDRNPKHKSWCKVVAKKDQSRQEVLAGGFSLHLNTMADDWKRVKKVFVAAGAKIGPAKARLLKASAPQPDAAAIESLRAEFPKVMANLQLPAVSYNTWLTENKKATGNKVLDAAAASAKPTKRAIDKVDKAAKPAASPAKRLKPKVVVAPGPSPVKPPRSPKKPKANAPTPRRLELPEAPAPTAATVKPASPETVNLTIEWRNVDTDRAAKVLKLLG